MNKSKINKIYYLCMFFIICSFSIYLVYKYDILQEYNYEIEVLNEKISEAEAENEELLEQSEYKISNEYIEKLAREKLGMIKGNEVIFYDSNK